MIIAKKKRTSSKSNKLINMISRDVGLQVLSSAREFIELRSSLGSRLVKLNEPSKDY